MKRKRLNLDKPKTIPQLFPKGKGKEIVEDSSDIGVEETQSFASFFEGLALEKKKDAFTSILKKKNKKKG